MPSGTKSRIERSTFDLITETPDQAEMGTDQIATLKGVAVAMVILARFLAAKDRTLASYLQLSLEHAKEAGLEANDLTLLRTLIHSVSSK